MELLTVTFIYQAFLVLLDRKASVELLETLDYQARMENLDYLDKQVTN